MIYRIFGAITFIIVIAGSVLFGGQREATSPTLIEEPLRDPGYAAQQAELIQTGENGAPLYRVDAARMRQLPGEGTVQLEQVQLRLRDTTGNRWTARAQHGEVGQNSGEVELSGEVHVAGVLPGMAQ